MLDIIYAGTPEFAVPALEALLADGQRVSAVYTQPDRPAGRGRKLTPSPVKRCALDNGLNVRQPVDFKSAEDLDALQSLRADLMVVAAYGLLLPPAVLRAPRLGCINLHASLLPRWRGASPIQQAILAGDARSGITLMKMDTGLDTGEMIASRAIDIDPEWSAGELEAVLAPLAAELLLDTLEDIEPALRAARPQDDSRACYAPRLDKSQAEVDWNKSRDTLLREIRAFNPWPVSFTRLDGDNLRLWRASAADGEAGVPGEVVAHDRNGVYVRCGDGIIRITELQFAGRKRCDPSQALNARNLTGSLLGRQP
ncbi:MAG: methionyl-tRNA formyltransferase [Gammaproteobacteria bacterium]|jgi:methionyl-tRNA formyltransferase